MRQLLDWLDRWERRLCVAAFSVLALVLFVDVLLRELSGNGVPWATQTGIFANLVVALFGMGLATSAGSHLRPRFADSWLPGAWDAALRRGGNFLSAGLLLFFALIGLQFVLETYRLEESATVLRIPLWPLQLLIPASFISTAVRYTCYAVQPVLAPREG
jgi:C4-dicarboxylate transporter DctQ subunit